MFIEYTYFLVVDRMNEQTPIPIHLSDELRPNLYFLSNGPWEEVAEQGTAAAGRVEHAQESIGVD